MYQVRICFGEDAKILQKITAIVVSSTQNTISLHHKTRGYTTLELKDFMEIKITPGD